MNENYFSVQSHNEKKREKTGSKQKKNHLSQYF